MQTLKAHPQHQHRAVLKNRPVRRSPWAAAAIIAAAVAALMAPAGPAWAQYKVVQPDGRVTYTDRPPADAASRVSPVGPARAAPAATGSTRAVGGAAATGSAAAPDGAALAAGLPLELRNAVQRYPVTLLSAADCLPCDDGRRLLQQRGIPHFERRVVSEDDAVALEKLLGTKTVPALMLGTQRLRGFVEADWNNFLDAAGYPRESRLPRAWKAPAATSLADKKEPPAPPPAVAPDSPRPAQPQLPPPAATAPEPSTPGRIRF